MKKWVIYSLTGAALVFAVVGYLIYAGFAANTSGNEKKTAEETISTTKFVTALGRIEPAGEVIKLTAPAGLSGAIVTELKVSEGDWVDEGQTVAVLDGYAQGLATIEEAKTRVLIAERKLEQIRAGAKSGDLAAQNAETGRLAAQLETARRELARAENPTREVPLPEYVAIERLERELANARIEYDRSDSLARSGVVSRSELDTRRLQVETLEKEIARARATLATVVRDKRLSVETLQKDLDRARSTYASLAEVRPTDVRAAQAEVENARAQVDKAIADLEQRRVKAYTGGRVLKIHARPGETIGNEGVLELGDTAVMFALAEVFEADIQKVRTGQAAEIVVRTSGARYAGTVAAIGSLIKKRDVLDADPVADVDARVVEVKIRLSPEASRQLENLTNLRVDARIAVE